MSADLFKTGRAAGLRRTRASGSSLLLLLPALLRIKRGDGFVGLRERSEQQVVPGRKHADHACENPTAPRDAQSHRHVGDNPRGNIVGEEGRDVVFQCCLDRQLQYELHLQNRSHACVDSDEVHHDREKRRDYSGNLCFF